MGKLQALFQAELPVAGVQVQRSVCVETVAGFPDAFGIHFIDKQVARPYLEILVEFPAESQAGLVTAKGGEIVVGTDFAFGHNMQALDDLLVYRQVETASEIVRKLVYGALGPSRQGKQQH